MRRNVLAGLALAVVGAGISLGGPAQACPPILAGTACVTPPPIAVQGLDQAEDTATVVAHEVNSAWHWAKSQLPACDGCTPGVLGPIGPVPIGPSGDPVPELATTVFDNLP